MTGTSILLPQTSSCSIAAALNVSAAASITLAPPVLRWFASLALDVVLPVPLTPTTKITFVLSVLSEIGLLSGGSIFLISSLHAEIMSSGLIDFFLS